MKKSLLILSFWLQWLFLSGQSPVFSFRNISINEGLSQSSVVDIAVDKTGFLWFATQDGLNRYDGKEFRLFNRNFDDITTSSGNRLGKIMPGNNNELWLITSGGKLEKLNLYDDRILKLDKLEGDSLSLPELSCLHIGRDELFIGTVKNGLIRYDPAKKIVTRYSTGAPPGFSLSDDHIQSIFADSDNQYWILTKNGVTHLDPAKNILQKIPSTSSLSCSAAEMDDDKNLWLGSFGKGLFIKSKSDTSFRPFTGYENSEKLPADLVVETIMADKESRIWVGTYGRGLYIINKKTRSIQHLLADKRKPTSLGYNDVLSIKQDPGGGIWIGTDGGGVSYYHKALNNFLSYSGFTLPSDIDIDQVRAITTDKSGMIWAGTSGQGLVFIDPVNNITQQFHFPSFQKNVEYSERIVSLLCDDDGDIWAGTQGNGLMILDAKTKKVKKWFHPDAMGEMKIPDHTIWCMLADKGRVWAGTRNAGLCLVDKQTGVISNLLLTPGSPTADDNIRALLKMDDSTICIGYERKGIRILHTNTNRLEDPGNEAFNKIWADQTTLKCIYYRAPFLLAGTQGSGFIIYDLSTRKITVITDKDGLPNNTVYGIVEDREKYLWLSTNKGLSRFSLSNLPDSLSRSDFTLFSVEDGLQSNEFNTGAYYAAPDGMLYFGGIRGLTLFNPSLFTSNKQKIPVVVTQATINNEAFSGDTVISYKNILRLDHNQNSVSFNFAALDYISGSRLNYFYRLKGYDNNWVNAGDRNYAAYTNLSPGKYTFEVRALNQVTNEQSAVTSLLINITPPFWQRWWFIGFCLAAIASALYGLYRYRVNQLLQIQRVRTRIATDLHDDIGSTLTNINILSELSMKNIDNRPEAEKFLMRISEEVSTSGQALDDIVWSINKNNDSIEQTVARMRRYAAEMFEGANITYSLQSDDDIAHRKLNMELRRDYYLLFKELINNVYKHAGARNVQIKVWLERNRLLLRVKDDGVGFDVKASTHRNGIKNMYIRAEKWNGDVDIQSEPGKGTTTRISLELDYK